MLRTSAIRLPPARWLGACLLVALVLFFSEPAFAHASLLASDPPTGAILKDVPPQVVLTFSEPSSALAVQLLDEGGVKTSLDAKVTSIGNQIVVALPLELAPGTHVLAWRAASSDGHPIAGTVIFSIGSPTDAGSIEAPAADGVVRGLLWLARATMLIALLLGAGSSGFRMVAEALPNTARRIALIAVTLGAAAAVASIPLHGLDALGRPLGDFVAPEVWAVTMRAGYGASVIAALLAMVLASISVMARKPNLASSISVLSLIAIGLTATLSGHASSADPRWLTRSMVFLHIVSIAWWAGELLPLAVILRQSHAIADPPLMRFSRFIPFVIAPLVISGVTLAAIQLGPPGEAWLTPYTYLFAAKLILLFILFVVAGWNRWYLTAKVMSGDDAATRHLGRAIALEIVLIMVIVCVAAGWRFTPPPRTLAVQLQSEATARLVFPKAELLGSVSVSPGHPGENIVTVVLNAPDGAPAELKSVRVGLANEALGIPKIVIGGALDKAGIWKSEAAQVPAAGDWTISVEVRISDFVQVRGSAVLAIGPPSGPG